MEAPKFRVVATGEVVDGRASAGVPEIWIFSTDGMRHVDRSELEPLNAAAEAIINRSRGMSDQ